MGYVRNAHPGGATNQAPEDGPLLREYGDVTKTEGCGGLTGKEGGETIKELAFFK